MHVEYLVAGALGALVVLPFVRGRERRKYPQTASMTRRERMAFGWSAQRYSRGAWLRFGAVFTGFAVLELLTFGVRGNWDGRIFGLAATAMFGTFATVCFVQAVRSRAARL